MGRSRHIEVARGTPSDNKKYCSKDEEFVEGGVLPVSNNDRFAAVRDVAQSGASLPAVLDAYPQISIQYLRACQSMINVYQQPRAFKTELYWFYSLLFTYVITIIHCIFTVIHCIFTK